MVGRCLCRYKVAFVHKEQWNYSKGGGELLLLWHEAIAQKKKKNGIFSYLQALLSILRYPVALRRLQVLGRVCL